MVLCGSSVTPANDPLHPGAENLAANEGTQVANKRNTKPDQTSYPQQGGLFRFMRGGDPSPHRAGKMEYILAGCSPPGRSVHITQVQNV
jgi:hypothetical protein